MLKITHIQLISLFIFSAFALHSSDKYLPKIIPRELPTMSDKLPIVYSDEYDMKLFGLEKEQPFDVEKYSKSAKKLKEAFGKEFYDPQGPISDADLLRVHTKEYLDSLKNSLIVARIAEEYALSHIPHIDQPLN